MLDPRNSRTSENRTRLKNVLKTTNHNLGEAYESILNVLNADNIPDNIRMAAFGIRELLNKLPDYINVPFGKKTDKLGMLTDKLKAKWEDQKIEAYLEITWLDFHIERIKNFLIECRGFFQLNDQIHVLRKEKAIATLRTLNTKHSEEKLPEQVEEAIAMQWNAFLDYFNGTLHSEYGSTDKDLFILRLSHLEEFLIGLLEPDVFESMHDIDEIIKSGENDAH